MTPALVPSAKTNVCPVRAVVKFVFTPVITVPDCEAVPGNAILDTSAAPDTLICAFVPTEEKVIPCGYFVVTVAVVPLDVIESIVSAGFKMEPVEN